METIRHLTATLVYDTRDRSFPRGVRAVVQRSRCILLMAEEFEVLLEIMPDEAGQRARLHGQLSADGLPCDAAIVLLDGPVDRPVQTTDRDGAFHFNLLRPGDYRLGISTRDCRIESAVLGI
jgi:hypothetical protein